MKLDIGKKLKYNIMVNAQEYINNTFQKDTNKIFFMI